MFINKNMNECKKFHQTVPGSLFTGTRPKAMLLSLSMHSKQYRTEALEVPPVHAPFVT